MRYKHFPLYFLLLCLFVSSCKSDNRTISINSLAEDKVFNYEVSTEQFTDYAEQNAIKVNFPVFSKNQQRCLEINRLLKKAWSDYISNYGDNISQLKLNADYRIMYANDKLVSIVFCGTSNIKSAAHPTTFAFSVNILMETPMILNTTDVVEINGTLVQKIIDKLNTHQNEAITKYFQQFNASDIETMLEQEDVFYYFTSDGIGVLLAIPHAIGDYVDILIPYEK